MNKFREIKIIMKMIIEIIINIKITMMITLIIIMTIMMTITIAIMNIVIVLFKDDSNANYKIKTFGLDISCYTFLLPQYGRHVYVHLILMF